MSTQEPGLDEHEWRSRYESVEADLRDDPVDGLPELRRLVEEMLEQRGYDPSDPVASEADDPEVMKTYVSAREIAIQSEVEGVDPSDVGEAIHGFTAVYEHLLATRQAP